MVFQALSVSDRAQSELSAVTGRVSQSLGDVKLTPEIHVGSLVLLRMTLLKGWKLVKPRCCLSWRVHSTLIVVLLR